ncbi:ATP-binding protein [Nguyenibacter vanlangensis]|uniref:AAA family ATPase n=1 Tax=Nguyenibacter vanlangensis TaxID=1216886 RepID=A0A7Y7ITN7_9PROT|nr:AAA family ATPase [Nguyenibacter vanlangensis]NVN10100.1 AAA family ATPase [Nguyenibacter vanlangensis]
MKLFPPFFLEESDQSLWREADRVRVRIPLTPKAFALLTYLVTHAGRLIEQDELLDAIWPGAIVEPQAVKKHIGLLRRALGDDPKSPRYIETVNKRGYRFIASIANGTATSSEVLASREGQYLVGRDAALARLRRWWNSAKQGEAQIVFVTGDAGIGKTTLITEFRRQLTSVETSIRIAQGQCIDGYGDEEPYGPILDVFGRLSRGPHSDAVVQVLTRYAPTWLAQLPGVGSSGHRANVEIMGASRQRMLREIVDAFEGIALQHPLFITIEDLQWSDDSTIDLIFYLARRQSQARLMLVITARDLGLPGNGAPTKGLMAELLAHQLGHEIALGPFSASEVRQLVQKQRIDDRSSETLSIILLRQTGGNPLFVTAALEDLKRRTLLVEKDGRWSLRQNEGEIELAVPQNIRLMIEAQIGRLSATEIDALELASVAGQAFDVAAIADPDDPDFSALEDLFERLSSQLRFLNWVGARPTRQAATDRYEFSHAIYRQVLYERLSARRRSTLHRQIGECLVQLYAERPDEIVVELAYHFEKAGEAERCIRYLRRSADIAGSRRAHAEAAAMLMRALTLVTKLHEQARDQTEAELFSALAAQRMAAFDPTAIETYEALARRASELGLIDVQAGALVDLSFYLSLQNGAKCLEVVERAQEISARQEPVKALRTLGACAYRRLAITGWDRQLAQTAESGLRALDENDEGIAFHSLVDLSQLLWMSGSYQHALDLALDVRRRMLEPGVTPDLADFEMAGALVAANKLFLGQWGNAIDELLAELAIAKKNENPHRTMWVHCTLSWVHLHALDYRGALEIGKAGASFFQDESAELTGLATGVPALLHAALICMGSAAAALGNVESATRFLNAAMRDIAEQPVIIDWYWHMQLDLGLTTLHLHTNKLEEAQASAERLYASAISTDERTWRALACETLARVALAKDEIGQASVHIAEAIAELENFDGPIAAWRVHATAARTHHLSGRGAAAEVHLVEARRIVAQLSRSLTRHPDLQRGFMQSAEVLALWPEARLSDQGLVGVST